VAPSLAIRETPMTGSMAEIIPVRHGTPGIGARLTAVARHRCDDPDPDEAVIAVPDRGRVALSVDHVTRSATRRRWGGTATGSPSDRTGELDHP